MRHERVLYNVSMDPAAVFTGYLTWHYTHALRGVFSIWSNLLWFVAHFFSIRLLLRTLFSPWKRMHEAYSIRGFEDFFGSLVVNTMSRIVGALVRFIVICIGVSLLLSVALLGLLFFVLWICAPVVLVFLLVTGLNYLI